jgi:archaellum component FlaG (FlaF/FlaG flagellin family)
MRLIMFLAALCVAAPVSAQVQNPATSVVQSIADALQYAQPATGGTVVVNPSASLLIIDNGSLLLALTVTLPSNPVDGQRIIITSGSGVTALTINGGTVKGLITTISVNGYARFAYSATANAWFRTG